MKTGLGKLSLLVGVAALALGALGGGAAEAVLAHSGEKVDRDRLAVHRLDIVDGNGVTRMLLGAPTPDPIVKGVQVKRLYPVSGMAIFDAAGQERGGFGVADIPGGAPVLALDHQTFDAIGWKVLPDGSIEFSMNDRRADPGPKNSSAERIRLRVAEDGTPTFELADREDHPRLRLAIGEDGAGELQFLNAAGKVIQTIAPEHPPSQQ